jgi:hypothetical protein
MAGVAIFAAGTDRFYVMEAKPAWLWQVLLVIPIV